MDRILCYIKNGKGIGALFLLGLSALYVLISALSLNIEKTGIADNLQEVADQILPIKIEDGTLVVPHDVRRQAVLDFSGDELSTKLTTDENGKILDSNKKDSIMVFIVDPTIEALDREENVFQGIYLTKHNLFVVGDDEVRIKPYAGTGDIDIPAGDYREQIISFINAFKWIFAAAGLVLLFLYYFLGVLFFSLCTAILAALSKREISFDSKMRLNTVAFAALSLLSYALLHLFEYDVSATVFFCLMILAEICYLAKLPKVIKMVVSVEEPSEIQTIEIEDEVSTETEDEVVSNVETKAKSQTKAKPQSKPKAKSSKPNSKK